MILAQSTGESSSSVYIWAGILLIVVAGLFLGVYFARKRLDPNEDFRGEGFTLSDLRAMHKSGQLSQEEFERAKALLVEKLHAAETAAAEARSLKVEE